MIPRLLNVETIAVLQNPERLEKGMFSGPANGHQRTPAAADFIKPSASFATLVCGASLPHYQYKQLRNVADSLRKLRHLCGASKVT